MFECDARDTTANRSFPGLQTYWILQFAMLEQVGFLLRAISFSLGRLEPTGVSRP